MTQEEIIELLKERITRAKQSYEDYRNAYVQYSKQLNLEKAVNSYNWMLQEYAIQRELEIVLDRILTKGDKA